MKNILYIVFGLSCLVNTSYAQETPHHPWWVTLGGGSGFVGNALVMTAGFEYSYQFDRSILSGRILGSTNKNPTILDYDPSAVVYKFAEYGILYGPVWFTGEHVFSAGGGISLVRAIYENHNEMTLATNTSIGLPLEAQWSWRPAHFIGCGVYAFADVNFEKNISGMWLFAQIGLW